MVITMTPEQSKMARAALGWSLTRLATEAGIGRATVARFELGETVQSDSVDALRRAFVNAGMELIEAGKASKAGGGPGVRIADA
jgi:transcriptional regulator with XRE-family HTH domain